MNTRTLSKLHKQVESIAQTLNRNDLKHCEHEGKEVKATEEEKPKGKTLCKSFPIHSSCRCFYAIHSVLLHSISVLNFKLDFVKSFSTSFC